MMDFIQPHLKRLKFRTTGENEQKATEEECEDVKSEYRGDSCEIPTRFCRQSGVMAGKVTLLAWKFMLLP